MITEPIRTLTTQEYPATLVDADECVGFYQDGGDATENAVLEGLVADHTLLASWFTDKSRMGLVFDIDHVAGFLPHAFTATKFSRKSPFATSKISMDSLAGFSDSSYASSSDEGGEKYRLHQVQLVGLLLHDQPVAYVLETLPNMQNVSEAPTRSLDEFEQRGLDAIQSDIPLYAERHGEKIRALGALINAESCSMCHQGPSNQILGAFSYVLTKK